MSIAPSVVAALPQYQLGEQIGSGGMGVVYSAVHRPLGRPVAIKRLPGMLAEDQKMSARFEHEARLLARLDHPHIVPVYDYVQNHGEHLLVMEKLDGGTVWSKFTEEGLTAGQACAIGLATLSGLHAAHGAGVLHLDVKPKNLLFTSSGVLKVADFGISQVVSEGATLMTHAGQVLGTPAYIAPEQALGNPLTPAADVYGAGTVLYELLSGTLPYESGGGALAMIQRHVYQEPRPLDPSVPRPLAEVVMRSLARDPQARYRNAETFAIDLAGAAAQVFGPDWLTRLGVRVHLAPAVATGSTRPSLHPTQPRETLALGQNRVRATMVDHTPPATAAQLGSQTLIPASSVLADTPHRKTPRWFALAGTLTALVMLALPFSVTSRTLPTLPADLSTPLVVPLPETPSAHLLISAAGIPLADVTGNPNTGFTLPGATRWIVGGAALGTVKTGTEDREYLITPPQNPMLSIMGVGSAVLLLFTLAYLESILRSLRKRQAGTGATLIAAPLGFGLGAAVWLLPTVLLRNEPALLPTLACGLLGATSAVCIAIATRRTATR
ncbi:serine/threonine-protein kinase [Umezawaea tangerina]|uniref:non-specific serine/threonine protein kinase n=1 Tax=Umezawaea tangerina TaxID=84725 RepID=A0A2T0S8C9_9PSEU|nr:serine/threonine-protein kinase [Umezawaea tangerina]PRY29687.1 serine/threonine-protein kinase [Umezawaea tangerina]